MKADNSKIYNADLYLRLSKEDGEVTDGSRQESNSISNQKDLIMDYMKAHPEIKVHTIRVDDGFSGVDFNRPNFQLMLEDIKKGIVDCVIVKDLSRFGRNYIEAGRYIEKIFPMLGVRFIAITDHYDSLHSEDGGSEMIIPFKNLINDAYCRDISIKIRSHLEIKRKKGDYTGAFAVYGYMKADDNKNRLVADEYAAGVVRDIYAMKLSGMSQQAIADKLNQDGILSPLEYKKSIGVNLTTVFQTGSRTKWSYVAVTRILKNETYTGVLIQGKRTTPNYKVKTRINKAESEWARVENTHDAIITRNEFELVQEILKTDTRCAPGRDAIFPLAGILFCGDCLESMVRKTIPANGENYVYYVCSRNKKQKENCSPHRIREKELNDTILYLLQDHIREVLGFEEVLQAVDAAPYMELGIAKYKDRIKKKRGELEKAERRKLNLYEDLKDGIITKKEYAQLKEEFDRQAEEAESAIHSFEAEIHLILENRGSRQEWIRRFREYKNIDRLDRNVVVSLIKQVKVYEGKRIEITWQFEDDCERYQQIAGLHEYREADEACVEVV